MTLANAFTLLGLLFIQCVSGQDLVQNIKGQVTEKVTGQPLIGANVFILDSDPMVGVSTDINGYYMLEDMPVGRYRLGFSYLGYKNGVTASFLVTSGKESVQNYSLEEDPYVIEVEITSIQEKDSKNSGISTISIQTFDSELASRYAGSRSDVSRMAAGFAGVSANDDSRNDIIIRGNSPSGMLWRLNGIDIPNPSHFGALGATGGPVSMLNNNLLANSTFITGAFPSIYGNALSGVFDLNLRKGNKDKFEGMFGVSFNGFEGGLEGPLAKTGGSFFVNYRYSVIDLISRLGGSGSGSGGTGTGSAIPRYQDLSYHFYIPTKKLGVFSLFGLRGNSGIDFLSEIESSENPSLFTESNENLRYKTRMQVYGLTNKHFYNNNAYGKLSLSYSQAKNNTEIDTVTSSLLEVPFYRDDSSQDRLTIAYQYKNKLSAKHNVILGITANQILFNFLDSVRVQDNSFRTLRDFEGSSFLTQSYAQWQYKPTQRWTLNIGLYAQHFSLNNTSAIEPRFNMKYDVLPRFSISLGLGRNSKLQDYQLYLVNTQLMDGTFVETNKNLGMTNSDQAVVGFNWKLAKKWNLKSELYLQNLSNVPVTSTPSNFSALNIGADFNVPSQDSLVNEGTGRNIGMEWTLERSFNEGFYVLATLSIFESTYEGSDGNTYSTAFDNRYIANILTGKEFRINDILSISFDTKITLAGGRRYTPIDLQASIAEGEAVLSTSSAFNKQFDDYFRTDFQFTFKHNAKRLSQSFSFDLQNAFNNKNAFAETYDRRSMEITTTTQLGIFPVFEYRLEF